MPEGQMSRVIERVRRAALVQNGAAMTDGQLLECFIAERDEAAFEALVRRHADMVLGVCRRVVGHAQDAEDAFQATCVVLVRKAATVLPREAVGNWLYGVAYRTALEARARGARLRSREKQVKNMPEMASRAASAAGQAHDWRDLQPLLDRELSRLPDKYRLPVVLCDLEGRGREEVSHQLQLAEGTLSSRLSRGRKMLAGRLARRGLAISAGALTVALQQASAATAPATLVVSTIQAATMVAAGQAATVAVSASVAALTEGVLHAMFMTKVKTATVVLMLVALAGSGVGLITHQVLAGTARTPDLAVIANRESETSFGGRDEKPRMPPTFAGRIVAVAKDGKTITLETQPAGGGRDTPPTPAKKQDVKIGADTKIVYSNVGLGGAKMTEGYGAQVWIADGAKDVARQIHLAGKQADRHGPNLTGAVAGVADDGKTLTFKLAPRGRGEPESSVDIQLTAKSVVVFSNVAKGGARPAEGQVAEVWLADGSKSAAAKVHFRGSVEKFSRDVPEAKPDAAGKIVSVSKDGKVLTLEAPAGRGEEPVKHDVKVDDKTSMIYFSIGADGDRPTDGYAARVWLATGSKDVAGKVHFRAPDRQDPTLRGKVIGIAKDAKAITLEQAPKNREDAPGSVEVKLSPKTRLVFNGVGPEGATLSEGLGATVILEDGSKDTAAVIVLGPGAGGGR
jgi:RNA polymerase sigma factor (sigma-70 family)